MAKIAPPIARARARDMRRGPTPPERRLWQALRNRGLGGLKFRRQVPIGVFIVDFACDDAWLVVEVDGASHAAPAFDAERDAWLVGQGWRVLRIWNNDVMGNLDGVLQRVLACAGDGVVLG